MKSIFILAKMTFQQSFSTKVFWFVVFFAGLCLFLSPLLASLSFTEKTRLMADFSFLFLHLTLLILAIIFGAFAFPQELEKQTCLLILARPVSRWQFLMGKYLGILTLLLLFQALIQMAIAFLLRNEPMELHHFQVGLGIALESSLVLALSMTFSFVVSPAIAAFVSASLFLTGQWLPDLKFFAIKSQDAAYMMFSEICNKIIPHFYEIHWRNFQDLTQGVSTFKIYWGFFHTMMWLGFLGCVSLIFFRRKDLV